jgi:hydroxymethylbilane synthase
MAGKGVFTAELEVALREKRIDCAVHSLKDLPTEQPAELVIGATPTRVNPADVLVSREGYTLPSLPRGARVGTSSYRRAAQLLNKRPDLIILDIRGNVDTRVRKALEPDGEFDAIVLAYAGLERLGQLDAITAVLDFADMLPAPGQGAIAVQTRNEESILAILKEIHDVPTALAVTAERAFLAGLGGGCSVPVAARAYWAADQLVLQGRVSSIDGKSQIDVTLSASTPDEVAAREAGLTLAQAALARGAGRLVGQQA